MVTMMLCASLLAADLPPLALTPWREVDDVIDGWDWSLPPGTQPVPDSGVKYYDRAKREVPGNHLDTVTVSWRELEPAEGRYDWQPLRAKLDKIPPTAAGCEFHVYASVAETRYFDADGGIKRTTPGTAPEWLTAQHHIATIEEQPKLNIGTPFQVVNHDIWNEAYHSRYLRFVQAFGETGLAHDPRIMLAYVHGTSSSRGEEAGGQYEGRALECMKQRLDAWAKAFGGDARKLAWVGNSGDILDYAYRLGMGQRNGFVEMVLMHVDNRQLGQYLDDDGYLCVDESCPPIAAGRAFGDENEEYSPQAHVPRFGPMEMWPHRYRESMLRSLQMRRNFLWAEGNPWVDPPLLAYVSLELGRTVQDAPDIWCRLRESIVRSKGRPQPVKNFERWLYQRDREGYVAAPTARVPVFHTQIKYHPDHYYDDTARTTDDAAGQHGIGFAVDDRWLSGGPHRVVIKLTYLDRAAGDWHLVYQTPDGEVQRTVTCRGDGATRTASFLLDNAVFAAQGLDDDFELRAGRADAVVSMVRVIKRP